jgi:hypothetical protein
VAVILPKRPSASSFGPRHSRACSRAGLSAIAERQAPQAIYRDWTTVGFQRAFERAGVRIEDVDPTVADIADKYLVAEVPKIGGRLHDAPRGVELALRHEPLLKVTVRAVDVDESITRARQIIDGTRAREHKSRTACRRSQRCRTGHNRWAGWGRKRAGAWA